MDPYPSRTWTRRETGLLLTLLACALLVRGLIWANTEILARDGIGFIEIAQRLESESWSTVLREAPQHPLYPVHILWTAKVYRGLISRPLTNPDWQQCAHAANVLMGVLMSIPLFLLCRRLVGAWTAFGAVLLFTVLPVPAQVTSDTLSEGSYLCWCAVALWLLAEGLCRGTWVWFAGAGLASGLAYLTRPEGAVLPIAGLTVLAWTWLRDRKPGGWRRSLAAALSLSLVTCATVAPYWLTIGKLGGKNTFNQMLGNSSACLVTGQSAWLMATRFQPGVDGLAWDDVTPLFVAAVVVKEVGKGTHYTGLGLAVVGLVLFFRTVGTDRDRRRIGLLLAAVIIINTIILYWLGWRAHYLSERHTVLIVLSLCPFMMITIARLGRIPKLAERVPYLAPLTLVLLVGVAMVPNLKPRHQQRLAHRSAGEWLAAHWQPGDHLTDPYGYATFYAGRPYFFRKPLTTSQRQFVLMEPGEKDKSRLAVINEVRRHGAAIKVWPEQGTPQLVLYQASFHRQHQAAMPTP